MSVSRLVRKTVLAGLLISAPAALPAQLFDMGVLTHMLSIPSGGARPAPRQRTAPTPGDSVIRGLPLSGRPSAGARNVQLTYVTTPALRRQALKGYIQRARRHNAEAANALAAQFARHDYSATYHNLMSGSGLRDNDAIDAVTAYTLIGWQIAKKDPSERSNAKAEGVRRQIAPALAEIPASPHPQPAPCWARR